MSLRKPNTSIKHQLQTGIYCLNCITIKAKFSHTENAGQFTKFIFTCTRCNREHYRYYRNSIAKELVDNGSKR